jgi:two-component system chemotaxis response regulator CheY
MGSDSRMAATVLDATPGPEDAKALGRVLVVGEAEETRHPLESLLRGQGFHVVGAQRPSELVYELVANSPEIDVIVVDVSCCDFEPCSVIRRIKSVNQSAKVVLCSSPDARSSLGEALCAGALAVIVRPFDPDHIAGLLQMAMESDAGNDRSSWG